jgi:transposase
MFISKLSPEQWAEARRLRAVGESCTAIARRFGVTRSTVAGRARREAWPGPDGTSSATAAPRAKARLASPATADIHAEVARRLFGVIAVRTRMMELSMQKRLEARKKNDAGSELPLATMEERDDFAALIQDIKQVLEISPEPAATAAGRTRTANPELTALGDFDPHGLAAASEKDALRAELAERLGKMFPQS